MSLRADQEKERLKELAQEQIRMQEQAIADELQAVQNRKEVTQLIFLSM